MTIEASIEHQATIAAASPSRGRSIAGAVAPLVDDMHAAVGAISRFAKRKKFVPDFLSVGAERDQIAFEDSWTRVGWAVSAIALIEALQSGQTPNIDRALAWFEGRSPTETHSWGGADAFLKRVGAEPLAGALIPYVLDTFGRTSRLDVIRDESLRDQRNARKEVGSFYTPADVAYFMAASIARAKGVDTADPASPTAWFDPAAGSGVFLVAALRREKDLGLIDPVEFATNYLCGADISPQACDFSAFAVLHEVLDDVTVAPIAVWQAIRMNLVALDSFSLLEKGSGRAALAQYFPQIKGAMRLICNPPYASASGRPVRLGGIPIRSLYLPFIEMAWHLANGPADASCLVVPLAFGANTTADHRRTRTELSVAGGRWTMLFFDRQPHALFGEEAKTRATIAIRRPGPTPADIWTSGLLKWTSRQRREIFTEDRAVRLGPARIGRLVPKLSGDEEARLYHRINEYHLRRPDRPRIEKASPDEIVGAALSDDVFVGATAYNFLNVFRNYPDHLSWRGELSSSGIHKLHFASGLDADVATALLASRTAFWLWHTECDGFHVPSWFLDELPLFDLPFSPADRSILAELGKLIWVGLQQDILVSNNRKRLTFAFRPGQISTLRDHADKVILGCLGASAAELAMLSDFEFRVVSIDGTQRIARSSPNAFVTKKGSK